MQPSSSTNGENFPLNKTVKNDEEELPSCGTFELVVLLDKFTLGDKGQDDASVPNNRVPSVVTNFLPPMFNLTILEEEEEALW